MAVLETKHIDDDTSIVLMGYSLAFRAITDRILHHVWMATS